MKYLVSPQYKSGTVVIPRAETRIYIGGSIEDPEGHPIETAFGRLTGKTGGESVDFFTDADGYFEAYNLTADIYTMKIAGHKISIEVNLTGVESGFHEAGSLIIPEEE
jgi:hypothetical protein